MRGLGDAAGGRPEEAHLLLQLADIDARVRREEELLQRSRLDALTGLANRAGLDHALHTALLDRP